ncbi:MAG: hypothetical protein H6684_07770 [Deltaproteobacteria bacterium]|nr:hypothetical protein [Deltaproteobacteria bacterium]
MDATQIPDQVWDMIQMHLGYNDEEMRMFRDNPRNAKVLATAAKMFDKTIIFEVVASGGCNSQHKVGTRFYFSADGNLLASMAPKKTCVHAMHACAGIINSMHELWYAGVDPNETSFKRGGCPDVGVCNGGWGHIVVEGRIVDKDEAKRLFAEQSA